MKKVLFTIAAAVMMLAATSCKKENINEPENFNREPEAYEFLATVGGGMQQNAPAVKDGMGTMATFNPNDKMEVLWQVSDVIYVNGIPFTCTTNPGKGEGYENRAYFENDSLKTSGYQALEYHAFYSTSVTPPSGSEASGTLNAIQYYNPNKMAENLPMYAHSTDHWLNFSNICAAVKIYVPCTADSIVISNTTKAMNGAFTVSGGKASMTNTNPSAAEKQIRIEKRVNNQIAQFHACDSLYIAIPEGEYPGFCISFYEGSTCVYTTGPTAQGKNLSVTANKIYRIVGYKYTDVLPGKFSVSATDKVQFTVGNLLRTGSKEPYTYIFEDKQTGYRSTKQENIGGTNYYGYYNDCTISSYKVNNVSGYTMLTQGEMRYLLNCSLHGSTTSTTASRTGAVQLRSYAKVNDGTKEDPITCLLVAPDGATAFDTARHEYTLKEVNSMGLLCLPMAGFIEAGGSSTSQSKATSDSPDKDNTIAARYWTPESYGSGDKHFLQIDITYGTLHATACQTRSGKAGVDKDGKSYISRTIRLVRRLNSGSQN